MRRLRYRRRSRSRGQSLVEFTILMPVLMLLLLIAIDFGRVYLGYINLQNMARIAANYAATYPDGWKGSGDATIQARYQRQALADAGAINCELPKSAGVTKIPNPQFASYDLGGSVQVDLSCKFSLVTPFFGSLFPGNALTVSASAVFPVRSGLSGTVVPSTHPGVAPNIAFQSYDSSGNPTQDFIPGADVQFSDQSGGSPTSWLWDFGDPSSGILNQSTLRDPMHRYSAPGAYTITLTAANDTGTSTKSITGYINVGPPPAASFDMDKASGPAPLTVKFTDTSSSSPTAWSWTFGDPGSGSANTSTDQNPTHTFSQAGSYDVVLTVTNSLGTSSMKRSVVVSPPVCTVPILVNAYSFDTGLAAWRAAEFTGSYAAASNASKTNGSHNWTIQWQSIVGGQQAPCGSGISVSDKVP